MQISVVQISVMQNYPQDNPLLKQKNAPYGAFNSSNHCYPAEAGLEKFAFRLGESHRTVSEDLVQLHRNSRNHVNGMPIKFRVEGTTIFFSDAVRI